MKKTITFLTTISAFYLMLSANVSAAVSPTPSTSLTPEPSDSAIINDLKERIASRVAELKLVEKKGVIGKVTEVSQTQITVSNLIGETKFVDVDELTKFSSPSAEEAFGISDISKESTIDVLGLYNKQSRRILARFIDVAIHPKSLNGYVAKKDSENYVLSIIGNDGKEILADIENTTKTLSYSREGGLEKSGFSKIKEAQRIFIVGFPDKKDKKRIIATRIIVLPQIPKNPKIIAEETKLETEETSVPSTGSGKKLTPIKKQ